ncbi:MAG: anti-CBASS Acb1 family protein [Saprospiraceae bacterium]
MANKKIEVVINEDGFANAFTKRGTTADRNTATTFVWAGPAIDNRNLDLFNGDGLGHDIVDIWAGDATRNWISINEDDDNDILTAMDDIDAQQMFLMANRWAYATGKGVIYMGLDDGAKHPSEPLNENRLKKVAFLRAYNKTQVNKAITHTNDDPMSPHFGEQELYQITPANGTSFLVHRTRILEFDGIMTDDVTWESNDRSHLSIYAKIFERLSGLNDGYCAARDTLQEHNTTVFKMAGLLGKLMTPEGSDNVRTRTDGLDMSKSSLNSYVLDASMEEEITKLQSILTGIPEVITKLEMSVSSVSRIPATRLFGQSTKGLNVTSDNEMKQFFADVHAFQITNVTPQARTLCELIQLSKEGPTGGNVDPGKTIKLNNLWEESAEDKAKNYETNAKGDALYIDRGAPLEAFIKGRFVDNPDINIEESELDDDEKDALKKQIEDE